MAARIETDVCVVGAGYAGLTAARRLAQAGIDVVVLEAQGPEAPGSRADERRRIVLDILRRRFGPQAGSPFDYLDENWAEQEWTRGCSMAHFAPGVLTQFGRFIREPVGRIHWAGTETAGTSHGAIDGAVRSGARKRG